MSTDRKAYATGTRVTAEGSLDEIRGYVERRDATNFTYAMGTDGGVVRFMLDGRWMQFHVERPHGDDQEWRRRWRVVLLKIKTAFEVYRGDSEVSVDEAFLPHIMLPDGTTFGQRAAADLDRIYSGELDPADLDFARPMLPAPS